MPKRLVADLMNAFNAVHSVIDGRGDAFVFPRSFRSVCIVSKTRKSFKLVGFGGSPSMLPGASSVSHKRLWSDFMYQYF